MPSLKSLRIRINSVKSTQKITKAMKMVAASKLRRAQEAAEATRPYAERMERMLASLAAGVAGEGASPLIAGTGKEDVHLLVVMTAERGLCGAFNSAIVRLARRKAEELLGAGKTVKILCVGKKGAAQLRRGLADKIIDVIDLSKASRGVRFGDAAEIGDRVLAMFERGEFDVASIFYSRFKSVLSQIPTEQRIIPASVPEGMAAPDLGGAIYEFEPDEETILADLLPLNLKMQVFRALLENGASEQGARMTAMDNATRNAGDMIARLTLVYNRQRQANITKELIEIISGAEAV